MRPLAAVVLSQCLLACEALQPAHHAQVPKAVQLRSLHETQKAAAASGRAQAERVQRDLRAVGRLHDRVAFSRPPRLEPHDIGVLELQHHLTSDALARLLAHDICAVHVRNFCSSDECTLLEAACSNTTAYTNWEINKLADSDGQSTEVDKIGVVRSEALDSFESFCEYLAPSRGGLDELLPVSCNPFERLRRQLEAHHPQGCERGRIGSFSMPAGTIRRMRSSHGLVHADTATLLGHGSGEFSANIYIRTPTTTSEEPCAGGRGALCIYPCRQYRGDGGIFGVTSPALLAQLQSLALRQSEGFCPDAQAYIRAALPLRRRLELQDGDLVLINTGRFHEVERYDEGLRLSGQSWISHRQGEPLKMWV